MTLPKGSTGSRTAGISRLRGALRYPANRLGPGGSHTQARIAARAVEQSTHRLGTVAILTALTVIGLTLLQLLLQPRLAAAQQTPLFRLSALFLVLASVCLFALERFQAVASQTFLDLGLVFEVAGAIALAAMENSVAWPDTPMRETSRVTVWIALCVLTIQNQPWKSSLAALLSALSAPAVHLMCASILGQPHLAWGRLGAYGLGPLFAAAWAPFISARLHQMQTELSQAQDLGSYHLEELLGRGGMGEVWRARHRLLRREAAVKFVLPSLLAGADPAERRQIERRFEQEAQAISGLRSPNTVSLFDFGVSDEGSMYYVMELLDGLDAETLVEHYGAMPPARVVSVLQQACESLEEAHEAGLVHRDVKPSNLFLCRLGRRVDFVKVLDFGLVKALGSPGGPQLTLQGETRGTPAFMSPEQVRGDSAIDARTDIYSLGCIAYFLLTGSLVFEGASAMAMAVAQVQQQPVPPSFRAEQPIPASLQSVVMACLEKLPANRPQTVAELASLLDECADVPQWTQADANRWWELHRPAAVARTPA